MHYTTVHWVHKILVTVARSGGMECEKYVFCAKNCGNVEIFV
jgi:hypothetical protein